MDDTTSYKIVMNDEEQYSIWPSFHESIPPGWRAEGFEGSKQECLARIAELWTDMRPLSLRKEGAPAEAISRVAHGELGTTTY